MAYIEVRQKSEVKPVRLAHLEHPWTLSMPIRSGFIESMGANAGFGLLTSLTARRQAMLDSQ
jgi:hypothetical protein